MRFFFYGNVKMQKVVHMRVVFRVGGSNILFVQYKIHYLYGKSP